MEEQTLLESLFGIAIPDYALWIAVGVIVVVVIALVAWGFVKELKKK